MIRFIFGTVNETNLEYAKKQTEFKTLQSAEQKVDNPEHNFFRKVDPIILTILTPNSKTNCVIGPDLWTYIKRMESL